MKRLGLTNLLRQFSLTRRYSTITDPTTPLPLFINPAQQNFIHTAVTFQSNVTFSSSTNSSSLDDENVIFVGTKKSLLDETFSGNLPNDISWVWDAGLSSEITKLEDKKTGQYMMCREKGMKWKRFTVCVVPEQCSRNNCATRPEAITSMLRGLKLHDSSRIYYASTSPTAQTSVASAIAKTFSRFTCKSGASEKQYLSKAPTVDVVFVGAGATDTEGLNNLATFTQLAMFLGDAPPNLLTTTTFAEIAKQYAAKYGCEFLGIRGEELVEKQLTGIYNVGKAATEPPVLAVLTYNGNAAKLSEQRTVFVGKGIVYDTGGLALKPATGMVGMKCDMGGAAATLCAFLTAAANKQSVNVVSILCLAENAMGPLSYRNDDIIRLHSGLTIEVNNTDAEGRLVLSDGLSYATKFLSPTLVVDMATLTGGQGVATGIYHAAIYTNSDAEERRFVDAGRVSGDLVFPLVYCPELQDEQFSSKVADMKNSVKNRSNMISACAARFLERSLDDGYKGPWVHVDIASPAFQNDQATGYGVGLLMSILS